MKVISEFIYEPKKLHNLIFDGNPHTVIKNGKITIGGVPYDAMMVYAENSISVHSDIPLLGLEAE